MPKVTYIEKTFSDKNFVKIERAEEIIEVYQAQGFKLTLRQLYYQFVARDWIPNTEREYKNLGSLISNARLAGWIDWEAIEDRTRFIRKLSHWTSPEEIIEAVANQYRRDKWEGQATRVEVWIEKDALVSIAESVCNELDVAYFSCRGYVSQSELWEASRRLGGYRVDKGADEVVVIHLGDHDPSGIDMTRDIQDRLDLFAGGTGAGPRVERVALTMDQINEFNPPPNPAKVTDARFDGYEAQYGDESWELDALDPATLAGIIRDAVESHLDRNLFDEVAAQQENEREELGEVSENWSDIIAYLHNE